jgi:uncharacterized membrane protein
MALKPLFKPSPRTQSVQVLARFFTRIIILVIFATLGSIGFARSLATLLWMSIVLCVVVGIMRRETLFRTTLNHWDETIAYAALYALICSLNQATPA